MMVLLIKNPELKLSESEILCLVELIIEREIKLSEFCELIVKKNIYKNKQSIRNFIQNCLNMDSPIVSKTGMNIRINIDELKFESSYVFNLILGSNDE
jgi:translation initiation factor 2 gamma subunit (eIF-2gamma)